MRLKWRKRQRRRKYKEEVEREEREKEKEKVKRKEKNNEKEEKNYMEKKEEVVGVEQQKKNNEEEEKEETTWKQVVVEVEQEEEGQKSEEEEKEEKKDVKEEEEMVVEIEQKEEQVLALSFIWTSREIQNYRATYKYKFDCRRGQGAHQLMWRNVKFLDPLTILAATGPLRMGQEGSLEIPSPPTHIYHGSPALGLARQQRFWPRQASVVDADINALMESLDGGEHGQNLFFHREVTLIWDEDARIPCTLTLGCQLLKGEQEKTSVLKNHSLFTC